MNKQMCNILMIINHSHAHSLHNLSRPQIKIILDNVQQLLLTLRTGPVREDGDGERLRNPNGIRDLYQDPLAQACLDQGLGHPPGRVGRRPVHLRVRI